MAQLAIPLAAGLALALFADALAAPADAAETGYLAVLVVAALLPAAALAVPASLEVGIGAVLVTTVAWAVPAGATRGAAVVLLLTTTLAVAAFRNLERAGGRLSWSNAIPLALGLQVLIRADRLLAPQLDLQTLVGLLALPVAGAAALVVLAGDRAPRNLLVAAATALVLAPGFSVSVTLGLLALAAAEAIRRELLPRPWAWTAAILLLAVSLVWDPGLGLFLSACALAHAGAGTRRWQAAAAALALAVAFLAPLAVPLVEAPERSWRLGLRQLSLLLLLLPGAVLPRRDRIEQMVVAALLVLVGLRVGPDLGALAAPLALLALAARLDGARGQIQGMWSGFLLFGTALLSSYPWLRGPLVDLLRLVGIELGWVSALGVAAVTLVLAAGWSRLERRRSETAAAPALALLGIAAGFALPPVAEQPLADTPVVLDADRSQLALELSGGTVSEVVLDSYLTDSAALAVGTPVAELRLVGEDGRESRWTLTAGVDTAEWAARRADVASLPGFAAPPPWLAWVAPSGDVLAQRYRARWRPDPALAAGRLELTRGHDLPPGVTIAVFHLELRP